MTSTNRRYDLHAVAELLDKLGLTNEQLLELQRPTNVAAIRALVSTKEFPDEERPSHKTLSEKAVRLFLQRVRAECIKSWGLEPDDFDLEWFAQAEQFDRMTAGLTAVQLHILVVKYTTTEARHGLSNQAVADKLGIRKSRVDNNLGQALSRVVNEATLMVRERKPRRTLQFESGDEGQQYLLGDPEGARERPLDIVTHPTMPPQDAPTA